MALVDISLEELDAIYGATCAARNAAASAVTYAEMALRHSKDALSDCEGLLTDLEPYLIRAGAKRVGDGKTGEGMPSGG